MYTRLALGKICKTKSKMLIKCTLKFLQKSVEISANEQKPHGSRYNKGLF